MGTTLNDVSTFAERFSEITRGKTSRQIADEISRFLDVGQTLGKSAVHNYLSGLRSPKAHILAAIARCYGVNEVWLLGYDVPKYKEETPALEIEDELLDSELIERLVSLSPDELRLVDAFVRGLEATRKA